jgi:hypothetical protein
MSVLLQRDRQLGAHRPGLIHHGAEDVEEQGVDVISGDHAPIVSPAGPGFADLRRLGHNGETAMRLAVTADAHSADGL